MASNDNDILKQHVEEIGLAFEKLGHSPIQGRVIGYLITYEPEYKTFDQIVSFLQASKSAVSNALNYLASVGIIDYKTFPGERKRYFYIKVGSWEHLFRSRIEAFKPIKNLIFKTIDLKNNAESEQSKSLIEFSQFIDLYEKYSEKMLEEMQKIRETQQP